MEQATIIALPDQTEIKWFTGAYWVPGDAKFEYYDTITSEKFFIGVVSFNGHRYHIRMQKNSFISKDNIESGKTYIEDIQNKTFYEVIHIEDDPIKKIWELFARTHMAK